MENFGTVRSVRSCRSLFPPCPGHVAGTSARRSPYRRRAVRIADVLFVELADCSAQVAATSKRNEKIALLADVLRRLDAGRGRAGRRVPRRRHAAGSDRRRLGDDLRRPPDPAARCHARRARRRDAVIERLAATSGQGSSRRTPPDPARPARPGHRARAAIGVRHRRRRAASGRARRRDGRRRRQRGRRRPSRDVQRAAMMAGSLPIAARVALTGGAPALGGDRADADAAGAADARLTGRPTWRPRIGDTGEASVEWKLDGARDPGPPTRRRRQALHPQPQRRHRPPRRRRRSRSRRCPAVTSCSTVRCSACSTTARRGASRTRWATSAPTRRVVAPGSAPFFFDVLHIGGDAVVDEPLSVRRELLAATVPGVAGCPRSSPPTRTRPSGSSTRRWPAGHEGVMVKDLAAPYDAGRRGGAWRKVKPVHTLDLVVIAVEWGHGRRTGWLSNLHLGARGERRRVRHGRQDVQGPDRRAAALADRALPANWRSATEGHVVHVRPEQVVEIAVDGVQASTRYPGRVALRFARVRRYRDDKSASRGRHHRTRPSPPPLKSSTPTPLLSASDGPGLHLKQTGRRDSGRAGGR